MIEVNIFVEALANKNNLSVKRRPIYISLNFSDGVGNSNIIKRIYSEYSKTLQIILSLLTVNILTPKYNSL